MVVLHSSDAPSSWISGVLYGIDIPFIAFIREIVPQFKQSIKICFNSFFRLISCNGIDMNRVQTIQTIHIIIGSHDKIHIKTGRSSCMLGMMLKLFICFFKILLKASYKIIRKKTTGFDGFDI